MLAWWVVTNVKAIYHLIIWNFWWITLIVCATKSMKLNNSNLTDRDACVKLNPLFNGWHQIYLLHENLLKEDEVPLTLWRWSTDSWSDLKCFGMGMSDGYKFIVGWVNLQYLWPSWPSQHLLGVKVYLFLSRCLAHTHLAHPQSWQTCAGNKHNALHEFPRY